MSIYQRGLDDQTTMFLGHMYVLTAQLLAIIDSRISSYSRANTLVDSEKSGLFVPQEIYKRHDKDFYRKRPLCMVPDGQHEREESSRLSPNREEKMPFVLEYLKEEGKTQSDEWVRKYEKLKDESVWRRALDPELLKPCEDAHRRAQLAANHKYQLPSDELQIVKNHVENIQKKWQKLCDEWRSTTKKDDSHSFSELISVLIREFADGPAGLLDMSNRDAGEIKASYAYQLSEQFGFTMAFAALCQLKARPAPAAAMTRQFGECMSIPTAFTRQDTKHK